MPRQLQAAGLPVPTGHLAEWPRTPLGFFWQPSSLCRGLVPTWSRGRGCSPASMKAATGGCSLLSAPAGTGKTSLVAAWVARLDRPVAWLALDERDQEVQQVLRYLVASLQTIAPECGRTALALLDAPPAAAPEMVLTSLLNDLAALSAPALLVLDDYHVVRAPAVHAAIEFFLTTCHRPCIWWSSPERTRRFRYRACVLAAR
jgi:hypothetical protein